MLSTEQSTRAGDEMVLRKKKSISCSSLGMGSCLSPVSSLTLKILFTTQKNIQIHTSFLTLPFILRKKTTDI